MPASKPDFKKMITDAEANQSYALRLAVLVAEQKRTFYLSCINEGFTEAQALELTKRLPT